MRVKLEATAAELETKGAALLKALATELEGFNPDLAEVLEKAAEHKKDPKPPTRVLRDIQEITEAEYQRQLNGMIADIMAVIDGKPIRKALRKQDDEEPEEPLEPGDYNPKTDDIVPEPEDDDEDEEPEEKSLVPQYRAGKAGLSILDPADLNE